jgi:hypothetical protein
MTNFGHLLSVDWLQLQWSWLLRRAYDQKMKDGFAGQAI